MTKQSGFSLWSSHPSSFMEKLHRLRSLRMVLMCSPSLNCHIPADHAHGKR